MRHTLAALAACWVGWASSASFAWSAPVPSPAGPVAEAAIHRRALALLAEMTPQEKAGQLALAFHMQPPPTLSPAVVKGIEDGRIGSVLFVSDPDQANALQRVAMETSRLKIPLLFGYDVIHGLQTIFPAPIGMVASWDPDLIEQAQATAAKEARAVGIDWTFAPDVDIARDPRWGRIVEGIGEDPFLGSAMAAAEVRGFQGPRLGAADHIIAGPKHFAGYGAALGGRDYDEVDLSDSALWNVYLPPFQAAVKAGAGNIMTAYMPLNGTPAVANAWLLRDVLRGDWGFQGFVVSDAGSVGSLVEQHVAKDAEDAAVRALDAGVDMELDFVTGAFASLPGAVAAGRIPQARLDAAVLRILEAKLRLGLFEHPYVDPAHAAAVLQDPAHLELARIAAERSAVLLQNKTNLLPLDRKTLRSIAVIGPLADSARDTLGPWVFDNGKPTGVSILQGLKAKLGGSVRVDYAPGVQIPPRRFPNHVLPPQAPKPPWNDDQGIGDAVAAARRADVAVIVVGETFDEIGENASRTSLSLPGRQQELIDRVVATGTPVVLIVMSGRPLEIKTAGPRSILEVWYPGSLGGVAVANLLFGDAIPGGKLPFSWPRSVGQAPTIYARLLGHSPRYGAERYWDDDSTPLFPFGFGLSYSSFAYANLRIVRDHIAIGDSEEVSVDVKNTGERRADEVVQLYVHQRFGASARPVRELKGFERVSLEPGQVRTVHFTLGPDALRYWSAVGRAWRQDPTDFDVWAGGSSDAALSGRFAVTANP